MSVLSEFSRYSGLKVNFDKTKVVWIGKHKFSSNTIKTKWKLVWNQSSFKMLGIDFHVNLEDMISLNYKAKIHEIEKAIKQWNRRIITPIGKITVIKSLLVSKLTHVFSALPNPPEKIIKSLNDLFFEFIWNGKDKIKRSVIIKEYQDGGLRMLNLKAFINAQKTMWIKKLIAKDGGWSEIIKTEIDIHKLVYTGKHYPKVLSQRSKNIFWKDTFLAFFELIDKQKTEKSKIGEYPLFYNQDISIGSQSIFLKSWFDAGIMCIGDLRKRQSTFLNLEEFNEKYCLNTNHLLYRGVIQATEQALKKMNIKKSEVQNVQRPFIPPYICALYKQERGTKYIYTCLNKNLDEPSCKSTWKNKMSGIDTFSDNDWKLIFNLPFVVTLDANIQWFQCRVIHRILGTNYYLHKI